MPRSADLQPPQRATLGTMFRRIWTAVIANKALVAAVFVAALLQAFFTKAPLVVIAPVIDALSDGGQAATQAADESASVFSLDERIERWIIDSIGGFGVWVRDTFGIDFGEHGPEKTMIFGCALIAALAGVLGGTFIYLATVLSRYFATRVVVDMRNELAAHLMALPLRYFGKQRMGELISNLTNNTQVLSRSFTLVSDHVFVDPLMILFNVGIIAVFEPTALLVMIPAIPIMALPMIRLGRRVHRRSGSSLAAMEDATESMNQMLSGIKTVKTFQLEPLRMAEFRRSNEKYLHQTKRMLQAKGRSQALVFVGYQIAFAVLVVVLSWTLLQDANRTIGSLAMVLVPITTTYTHVKRLSRTYNTVMESLGALDAIEGILAEGEDVAQGTGGVVLERVQGRVAMRDVRFTYDDDTGAVLHGIDFDVAAGTSVALVGASGAGKSTIVDLLVRLHDPAQGSVLIDGHDLRELDIEAYRRQIAMVVQQPFLFNTTIHDNIACGRPGASREQVEEAARAAQIHDHIASLPEGYDSIVGERGSNLSGGQAQRIAIARAMVRDPAILILDEATAALDSENEEAVQTALKRLMRGRTSFEIAHRLSTIRDADVIFVLDGGAIVEQGKHDELIERDGIYRRMIELQKGA